MRITVVMIVLLWLTACGKNDTVATSPAAPSAPQFGGQVVATIHDQPIAEDLLLSYLHSRGLDNPSDEQRSQALDSLVDLYLLEYEARQAGMLDRRAFRARLEVQRLTGIANEVLADYAREHPISEDEIKQAYEAEISNRSDQEYRLHHILLPDEQGALAIIRRLEAGEDFAAVETELAARVGSSNAGALGWVNLAQVPASFAKVLPGLEPGQFTHQPVASEYGYHVLYLAEQRSFEPPALESLEEGIRQSLGRRRLEQHMAELRAAAGLDQGE